MDFVPYQHHHHHQQQQQQQEPRHPSPAPAQQQPTTRKTLRKVSHSDAAATASTTKFQPSNLS
ncbi:hypothetical protein HK104_002877, partial [Borealophlyctis nickersoniae]